MFAAHVWVFAAHVWVFAAHVWVTAACECHGDLVRMLPGLCCLRLLPFLVCNMSDRARDKPDADSVPVCSVVPHPAALGSGPRLRRWRAMNSCLHGCSALRLSRTQALSPPAHTAA